MTPYFSDHELTMYVGDARAVLAELPDESVHCVVTSPPYYGLRDYGVAGQIGLEATPEAFVEALVGVFREVRRVLRRDGTCWVNLGDSYASHDPGGYRQGEHLNPGGRQAAKGSGRNRAGTYRTGGLKPKDRMGIPHRVVFALQQPYYTGRIRDERDRIWLAAMLDAEGCIYIHKRPAGSSIGGGRTRPSDSYSPGIEIANTSVAVIERIRDLVGAGSITTQGPEENRRRKQTIYRWHLRSIQARDFLREVYPHLVAKPRQARIALGAPSSGGGSAEAHAALIALHRGAPTDVDYPAPPSMFEQGWWLRDEIVWSKSNPMPSSVRDRTTPSHEFMLLLSRSARYYYDAAAIAEPASTTRPELLAFGEERPDRNGTGHSNDRRRQKVPGGWDVGKGAHGTINRAGRTEATYSDKQAAAAVSPSTTRTMGGFNDRWDASEDNGTAPLTRNKRSVWTIATQPFPEAHFATFPEKLVEPCILAGSPERVCPCGAPWVRETKVEYDAQGRTTNGPRSIENRDITPGFGQRPVKHTETTGWRPSCDHAEDPVRAVVLDPFGGSGTVALVANRLGRKAVHVDLSPEYAEIAVRRLRSAWEAVS